VIRSRFAADGSLWVGQTGRGWRSVGEKTFGLQRIRWDGKTTPTEMHSVSLTKTGFRIQFTKPINRDAAANPANYAIKHWGYIYQADYGSPKVGLTDLTPTSVKVSADNMAVELELPLVKERVYQLTLSNIPGQDGTAMTNPTGYYTLNRLRE
jgi:streptogramin lyase